MKKNRLAINIIFFINGFLFSNWAARIPRLQSDFALDNRMLGFVLLASAIGSLIAMPFTGWMISRAGSKQITKWAAILYIFSIPLFTISPNVTILFATFFLMGVFVGNLDVAMNSQAVLVEGFYKRPIMSFFHAIFSAGMMSGAGISALFSWADLSLKAHLGILALCAIPFWTWSIYYFVQDKPKPDHGGKTFFHLPQKALLAIGFIAFCCMLGEGAMSDWTANYLKQIVLVNDSIAAIGLFAFSAAMMTARFLGDNARAKYGDRKIVFYESIIAIFGLSVALLFPFELPVMIGFFLVGVGLAVIVPIAYSQAGAFPGLNPGVGIGMVTTIGYAGFIVGPPIIGFLADWFDLRLALIFVLVLFVFMSFLTRRI
jgi:MFS family permease